MSLSSAYKPSPLSFGSPRTSPFRRPESPSSPSTTIRPSTPTHSSTKPQTPSKLQNASAPIYAPEEDAPEEGAISPNPIQSYAGRGAPVSPSRGMNGSSGSGVMGLSVSGPPSPTPSQSIPKSSSPLKVLQHNVDALARLPPSQVREMREAFQILDRDSDGFLNRGDVADMLANVGLDPSPGSVSPFFPSSTPHPLPLPTYLSSIATPLAMLSPQPELLAALNAFDDDDSGQVDVMELQDALLNTSGGHEGWTRAMTEKEIGQVMDGFMGRRAFGKGNGGGLGNGKGEVFRYREWVAGLGSVGEADGEKTSK